ncbi:MAG: HAMP domain-containing histidine kinase [Melioribacteraceae bacterium]|nr:HAMP domain-containing histidine kinase [Melioribacteraceae bacterium]
MYKILLTFLFSLLFMSNLFAEEDLYAYKFNLDTIIVGQIVGEGQIFPNSEIAYISIFNTYKDETIKPYIEFFDEKFTTIKKISFKLNQRIKNKPLIFDFDGDSFDEVVFAITEENKLKYLYFDPSNTPIINTEIFELHVNKGKSIVTNITPAQLDEDSFYELILTVSEQSMRKLTIRGMWAVDVEKKKVLWENLTSENLIKSNPINIVNDSLSFLIYSGSGRTTAEHLSFSNEYYFFSDRSGNTTSYNKYLKISDSVIIDTNAADYSVDSIAFVRAVDSKNNQLWERIVGGREISTQIDTVSINNEKKILLAVYGESIKYKNKNFMEILNLQTGAVENSIVFNNRLRSLFIDKDRVFVSFSEGKIIKLNFELSIIDSSYSSYTNFRYHPIGRIEAKETYLLLAREGSGLLQNLVALNDELNIVSKISVRGSFFYLPKSKLISIYNTSDRKSKLFSIKLIPWYDRISPTLLRNITISFLSIIIVTMLLWIVTLRVSSKKINRQKKEIEDTHRELKKTTSKLIRAEKLAVYGTIASGIAHEINSPLGAIINSAQRIKNNPDTNFEKNIALIEKAGKRSKAIIETLLVSTRKNIDDNTILLEVLNDWMELSKRQFDNLGIKFISDINCSNMLAISSTELNQIFTNLLFNARDAITENNSSVKEIYISAKEKDNYCILLIKDTGGGFSEEKLKNPFEAFETSKEKGKGTGLGLWVVKSILDNINGSIQIKNYETGAEIVIAIPLFEKKQSIKND